MRDNRCVLLVFFDLPNATKPEATAYRKFRKCLIDEAYLQLQESVYTRMFHHPLNLSAEISRIKQHLPDSGNIFVLPLKLSTFQKMMTLVGESFDFSILSDTLLVL